MAIEALKVPVSQAIAAYPLRWRSRIYAIFGLVVVLLVVIMVTSLVGSTDIPLSTIVTVMLSKLPFLHIDQTWSSNIEIIIFDIRLPRILLSALVGAALAVAGATYQGLFRNPLADPLLIGVSQGAGLGAIIGFMLPAVLQITSIPILAFTGAVSAIAVVYMIAKVGRSLPMTTLILAGVALGAFLQAISSYLMLASGDRLHGIISWLLGTLSLTTWSQVFAVIPYIFAGLLTIYLFARPLNVMQLDEEQAQQLGINVEQVKLILLAAATLITAAAVSFCGIIGFVGIIIPHAVRLIWGPDYRFLLPLATVSGAIFLILADTAARTVIAPTEIPVGAITAFFGAPFFLYLLRQKKRAVF
ncbi:MAG TPA: iron ABC transporter [Dehalococcoidia bacterium]|nr:iron ABC transporter [Dehalococcoidia bacterium]